jgi:regulator of cell morphogenesis and NO signaling
MALHDHIDWDNRTVGEIAATVPGATSVFRRYKVNFCCGGDATLEQVAGQRAFDMGDLVNELEALEVPETAPSESWNTDALIEQIFSRYHETHRRDLTELIGLARKVEAVHAAHPTAPHGLADLLHEMAGELEMHMKKEELILFPAMSSGSAAMLDAPIAQMRHDHSEHGIYLQRLETLTTDFTPPPEACRSWQALYALAAKFADDLVAHVHLENNILFPRFQAGSTV